MGSKGCCDKWRLLTNSKTLWPRSASSPGIKLMSEFILLKGMLAHSSKKAVLSWARVAGGRLPSSSLSFKLVLQVLNSGTQRRPSALNRVNWNTSVDKICLHCLNGNILVSCAATQAKRHWPRTGDMPADQLPAIVSLQFLLG